VEPHPILRGVQRVKRYGTHNPAARRRAADLVEVAWVDAALIDAQVFFTRAMPLTVTSEPRLNAAGKPKTARAKGFPGGVVRDLNPEAALAQLAEMRYDLVHTKLASSYVPPER
jgi:hypothetical protein